MEEEDDDAPEAVSLSMGKKMALDLKKKETQSQKAYKQEQKERARKLFHSDNVRSDKEEISFLDPSVLAEIEEDESKEETEQQRKKAERGEKRKRKREAREAREEANKPKRKKFSGGLEVVLSSEVGGRSINNRARARVNCHFRQVNRSSSLSCHSGSRKPSSSFA